MQFLHLLLLVVSCITCSKIITTCVRITSELDLEVVDTSDDGFVGYAHNHLADYMRAKGIDEYFVRNLIINDVPYGPRYLHLNPRLDNDNQIIFKLDFGNNEKYKSLENSRENDKDIMIMFRDLINEEIFEGHIPIMIKNVIVNGISYGEYKVLRRFGN